MTHSSNLESVVTIDCQYVGPEIAAAYLLREGERALFVDNNTTRAVPLLMDALDASGAAPESVEYLIVTHIHLDHAAGTAALLKRCPNATVLCHPRAARHLINPKRLVASAMQVYGEAVFRNLYGEVEPVPAERVRTVQDGETLVFGERTLRFLDTPGHARHHICIHDSGSNGVFAGDCFGLYYPALQTGTRPLITCSSTPTEFDPDEARTTVARILDTGAARIYVSHFGVIEAVRDAAQELVQSIDGLEQILIDASRTELEGDALETFCRERVEEETRRQFADCGVEPSRDKWERIEADIVINARGLAYQATRRRRGRGAAEERG